MKATTLARFEHRVKSNLSTTFSTFDTFDPLNQLKIRHLQLPVFRHFACCRKSMLKISIKDRKAGRLLVLEGKLIAPWTNELTVTAGQGQLDKQELVVDLRGVTDISVDGEEALYCLMAQGAQFRGAGVFVKAVLKELAQRMRRDDSSVENPRHPKRGA